MTYQVGDWVVVEGAKYEYLNGIRGTISEIQDVQGDSLLLIKPHNPTDPTDRRDQFGNRVIAFYARKVRPDTYSIEEMP